MFRRDRTFVVGLAVANAIAEKLRTEPSAVIERAVEQLPQIRKNVRGGAIDWVDEWAVLLNGPLAELERALLADDQHGASLRSVAPFNGILSQDERRAALRTALPEIPASDDASAAEIRRKIDAL